MNDHDPLFVDVDVSENPAVEPGCLITAGEGCVLSTFSMYAPGRFLDEMVRDTPHPDVRETIKAELHRRRVLARN
jgi:hypothetical protein